MQRPVEVAFKQSKFGTNDVCTQSMHSNAALVLMKAPTNKRRPNNLYIVCLKVQINLFELIEFF